MASPEIAHAAEYALDARALRRNRDRAAERFAASAVLADEVARRMSERLDLLRPPEGHVLDLGCNVGAWTRRLKARYAERQVFALEPSLRMARRAAAEAAGRGRFLAALRRPATRTICSDIDALPFRPGSFAMIWSNLATHWFADPVRAWRQTGRVLRPGGLMMFSTFGPDTLRELRHAWRETGRPDAVMPFPDMHDVGDALVHAGFADPVMDMEVITLAYDDPVRLVADLRDQGAVNAARMRPRGLLGPRRWAKFLGALRARGDSGRVPASFEVVYGHAWWPEGGPRRTESGLDIVQIHGLGGVRRPPGTGP
ncbi:MAG: methyltransferase domain-containing protein [Betaproteobacteria bacterium]|nr:methyltransferase domain-containing protein [Betaproteobacteria bacterium]